MLDSLMFLTYSGPIPIALYHYLFLAKLIQNCMGLRTSLIPKPLPQLQYYTHVTLSVRVACERGYK